MPAWAGGAAPTLPLPWAPQGGWRLQTPRIREGSVRGWVPDTPWPPQGGNSDTQHLPQLLPWVQEAAPHPSFGDRDKVGGGPGPEQGSFFLSLGKIYNFCFFFFLIFIFIYIDIYIYTHLVTRKEKKNRIRNNNNKKKYSGLKTIRSYHARRAGDCTRPTSGWRSRGGAGAATPPSPEPPAGVCSPRGPGGRGRSRGDPPGSSESPQASGHGGSLGMGGGSAPHTEIS